MSLPRRLEQVGIVVGSVLMVSLPVGYLWVFFSGPGWLDNLLVYVPGLVIGVLVALDILPVSYGQIWLFGIASWAATILLWGVLEVGNAWGTDCARRVGRRPPRRRTGRVGEAEDSVARERGVGGKIRRRVPVLRRRRLGAFGSDVRNRGPRGPVPRPVCGLGLAVLLLTTWLCLTYRPAEPKRVASFSPLALAETVILGIPHGNGRRSSADTDARQMGRRDAVRVRRRAVSNR